MVEWERGLWPLLLLLVTWSCAQGNGSTAGTLGSGGATGVTSSSSSMMGETGGGTGTGGSACPCAVAMGDLNGDGKLDIAVTNYDYLFGSVSVLLERCLP